MWSWLNSLNSRSLLWFILVLCSHPSLNSCLLSGFPNKKLYTVPLISHACWAFPAHSLLNMNCIVMLDEEYTFWSSSTFKVMLSFSILPLGRDLKFNTYTKQGVYALIITSNFTLAGHSRAIKAGSDAGIVGSNPTQGVYVWCVYAFILSLCWPVCR
jgi:hypothetical protein